MASVREFRLHNDPVTTPKSCQRQPHKDLTAFTTVKTSMHSSRMRTARSLPYGGAPVQGVLCRGEYVWGGSVSRGSLSGRAPPDCGHRILDTRLWKHYLPATLLQAVKNKERIPVLRHPLANRTVPYRTQAVYKSPHSTVWERICQSALDQRASASRKSQSIRLEHVSH